MALCPICAGTGRTTGLEHPAGESKPCPRGCRSRPPDPPRTGPTAAEARQFIRGAGPLGRSVGELMAQFGLSYAEAHQKAYHMTDMKAVLRPDEKLVFVAREFLLTAGPVSD